MYFLADKLSIIQKYQRVIMKDFEIKVLDEEDYVFIETLKTLGISRKVAMTMAYLMNVMKLQPKKLR